MRAKPQTVATSQNKRVRMRRNASFTLGAGVRTRAHTTRGPLWWARLKHGIALGTLVACRLLAGPALCIPRATSCMCPPFAGGGCSMMMERMGPVFVCILIWIETWACGQGEADMEARNRTGRM